MTTLSTGYATIRGEGLSFHSLPYSHYADPFSAAEYAPLRGRIDATRPRPAELALSIHCSEEPRHGADLPVLVYIHGGRFEKGSHAESVLRLPGTVVVHVGYRTGLPGFQPFPDDLPFHFRGIDDVNIALDWVQRHIEDFGGDPTNVTLMGQSAGASIALWLARKDHFRGSFRRVLALSPAFPRAPFSARKLRLRQAMYGSLRRDAMRRRSAARIARAYKNFRRAYPADLALGPYPLAPQEMADVPVVVTSAREEFCNDRTARWLDKIPGITHLLAPRFGVIPGRWNAGGIGKLSGDSSVRRFVQMLHAEGGHPTIEFVRAAGPAFHCDELPEIFRPSALQDWVVGFTRGGTFSGHRRYALDTQKFSQVDNPLAYLDGAFTY